MQKTEKEKKKIEMSDNQCSLSLSLSLTYLFAWFGANTPGMAIGTEALDGQYCRGKRVASGMSSAPLSRTAMAFLHFTTTQGPPAMRVALDSRN